MGARVNCAVAFGTDNTGEMMFRTTNFRTFEQPRYTTRTEPEASFGLLAEAPIPVLEEILGSMKEYLNEWSTWQARYRQDVPDWETKHGSEFEADRQRYGSEVERFAAGLLLLRQNLDALQAFQLTNETFRRGPNDRWRIFQVIFLVSQIPGIVALTKPTPEGVAERNCVDIIYFPTGGGKTEAYLGVSCFSVSSTGSVGRPLA